MFCFYYFHHIELFLAHVNHKQRPESDDEEIELRKLAEQVGVPIYVAHFTGDFSEKYIFCF